MEDSLYSHIADGINSAVSRRKFLQLGAVGTGTILGGSVLTHLQALAAPPVGADEGILVMVYLSGGNDPLNTFVPYTENDYLNARPNMSLSPGNSNPLRNCLPLDDKHAFHAALPNIKAMYEQGKVNILPGIGFTGQDQSHFNSLALYQQGWAGKNLLPTGWIGRYLDLLPEPANNSSRAVSLSGQNPRALQGSLSTPLSLPPAYGDAYYSYAERGGFRKHVESVVGSYNEWPKGPDGTMTAKYAAALKEVLTIPEKYKSGYSQNSTLVAPSPVEAQLSTCAGVINSNLGARVLHVYLGGFDTHTNQLVDHNKYLAMVDKAIGSFFGLLSPTYSNRVTVMLYSEMGRRVADNGVGTDHGTAGMMMLLGNKVKGGIGTPLPSNNAANLDTNGNHKPTADYRQVYSEILSDWLKADAPRIIGKTYPNKLGLFASGPSL